MTRHPDSSSPGRIVQIDVSDGGVRKLPVPSACDSRHGVAAERIRDLR